GNGAVETGVDVTGRDGGAGQRPTARVRHGTENRGGGDLGTGGRRQRERHQHHTKGNNQPVLRHHRPSGWRMAAATLSEDETIYLCEVRVKRVSGRGNPPCRMIL